MSESEEQRRIESALGAEPGCCGGCVHAKLNATRRGTAYLRCLRAAWDDRLPRYPRLPVLSCPGLEPKEPKEPKR
ncbi:MAG TPA: hypothetical protein VFT75_14635 [Nocardioidaceae bacterium]|jgi:hypothetical protein|nr:hypothetical protein [Nocardioidaceae bacterium]